jgi:ABC-type spermidine/putrescine transport system permease subunit I
MTTEALTADAPGRGVRRKPRAWTAHLDNGPALLMAAPLLLAIGVFVIYPLARLLIDSFTLGDGGFSNYADALGSASIRKSIWMTLWMSFLVTALCLVFGATLAWAIRTCRSPYLRALLWATILLPFWMGVVVKTYAWSLLLSNNGLINSTLVSLGVIDEPAQLLYTPLAVVLGMTYSMVPYAVLSLYPTMKNFNMELLNASYGIGASRGTTMFKVWVPLMKPGFIAAGAIVFAISIGFYVTPVLLGGAQTPFMATAIGDDIFTYFNYERAAASSVILLVIAASVLAGAIKLVGAKTLKGSL